MEELTPQEATSDTTEDSEELERSNCSTTPQTHASIDPIIADLTIAAESNHIHEPMVTFTIQMVQETVTLPPINPATVHRFTDNDNDDDLGGRGGGPPGPGGGGPPQAPGGGGPPQQAHPFSEKFVGNAPIILTGDRSKTEQFLTQWELYWGVNNNNSLMRNTYRLW